MCLKFIVTRVKAFFHKKELLLPSSPQPLLKKMDGRIQA
jgi:hypothetical protein